MPQYCHSSCHEESGTQWRLWVTREWVGKGELPKKRTQLEVAEALRCAGRGHTWKDRSPSLSHKNLNAMKMSPGGDMVQRIVVE
ncbi:hypothetical protein BHM03_00039896 [Ensete ventricosum]|nr:hypothetical protein BHM03_00039896 [Ensete ventricosum]